MLPSGKRRFLKACQRRLLIPIREEELDDSVRRCVRPLVQHSFLPSGEKDVGSPPSKPSVK